MVTEINHGLQEHQPHVVALMETHLQKGSPTPSFPGYSVHRLDRTSGEKDGGVALLVADGVQWSALPGQVAPESLPGVEAAGARIYPEPST